MSFEYTIRYVPHSASEWAAFVKRLDNPVENGWPSFKVELTERGVYFCDNGRSAAAAVALRRIIDKALTHGGSVILEEAG
jgi:hypothetical protein